MYYVYIMTNKLRGVLYIGITNDLLRRVYEHREAVCIGFTSKYKLNKLVYYEIYSDPLTAIQREKNLKHWLRRWKIALIEKNNPSWADLYAELF